MDKFELLKDLGAGDFSHLNGSLMSHLKGTEAILNAWGATETLKISGLFHAAYGTSGFDQNMVSLDRRSDIANLIGAEAEELVYLYCSCDRSYVYPQFGSSHPVEFKDRFNNSTFSLSDAELESFCELTAANELELATSSDDFKLKYGKDLLDLFQRMHSYLSPQAQKAYTSTLESIS
ncbi:DUF6817 domain-containing protein [Parendozoicomonas haliclonae]|uniref:DUF6817 domain-containing protein n=1 Tax=Parendozoicomonas haliclonae TaxID=1960125 RepID=A0A1X7ARK3_9GAMM|nr:hypothetical protein [Parendozoicomonas haliclonae]SMA50944.1 hypothetical protein EHSB41UT_04762 [Parendozoicomonas haliclonae]